MISDGTVTHLVCNRSGNPRPSRSTGKRQQKSQGSCKSGEFCLSHMKVMVNASSGQVTVEYCSNHTGHSSQIAHIPIPNQIKLEISSKLHAGVTVERIIDDIRNDVDGGLKRKHLATKLDINNIKRKINLENVEKDKNDSVSVRAWVKQLEKKEYNPILLFKCQGDEQGVNMDNLAKDDFLMVIQTEFLQDIMMQYGQNAILIDSTHGLTQHNFLLITVMTIDEHGEGVPIAWAISNIEDTALLVQYFRALHGNVGDIKCETLMSDCADQFFSAWISIFGDNGTKRLLCR